MSTLILALALLQEPQKAPAPQPDPAVFRKKIEDLEKRLPELDRKVREAVEKDDRESADRLAAEHKASRQEIEALQKQLKEAEAKQEPGIPWYTNFNLEAQVRATHWDDDLEMEDGIGWGAAVYIRDFLFFEYRRWEGDDELSDDDAWVQSYELGLTNEFSLSKDKTSKLVVGGGIGIIHFATEAPGSDGDSGPILSFSPMWKFYFSPGLRFTFGGDIDIQRSDFNQNHTHTNHTFSLLLSIELAY